MKVRPMTDDDLVQQTARNCLQRHGPIAIERLRERAEIAAGKVTGCPLRHGRILSMPPNALPIRDRLKVTW
jgi:hypothetical protein